MLVVAVGGAWGFLVFGWGIGAYLDARGLGMEFRGYRFKIHRLGFGVWGAHGEFGFGTQEQRYAALYEGSSPSVSSSFPN